MLKNAGRLLAGLLFVLPLVTMPASVRATPSLDHIWVQFDDSGELKQLRGDLGPVRGPEGIKATVVKYRALFTDPAALSGLRLAKLVTRGHELYYKFQQTYRGIDVLDSALIVSVIHGRLTSLVNDLQPNLNLPIAPRIDSQEAETVARQVLHACNVPAQTRLVVYTRKEQPVLAYAVALDEGMVFVDARTADILRVETQLTRSLQYELLN